MYMEAYGNVGSVADSIIKKSIEAGFTRKMAKEDLKDAAKETKPAEAKPKNQDVQWSENAISNDGVSPKSEGVGSQANPNTDEISQAKAQESLRSQIKAVQERNNYLQELADSRKRQIDAMNKDIGDINNVLKGMIK